MKAENVMVLVGTVLIVAGLLLSLPNLKLQISETGCLQYVPNFPSKLKEGEVIYADEFVFMDRTKEWIQVWVELWNGSVVKSKWIPPSQKVWDFRELQIKMPSQPAFLGVTVAYSEGQPQSDSDFHEDDCFGVWISLDGTWKYPLDYSSYNFKVYGVTFTNNILTVDVDFKPRSPDIGDHVIYAMNFTRYESRQNRPVKIADLQSGRHTYTVTIDDLTHVRFDVYYLRLYIPKSQFGTAQTPPQTPQQQPSTGEQPSNENPPEYPPLQTNAGSLPQYLPPILIVAGLAFVLVGTKKRH